MSKAKISKLKNVNDFEALVEYLKNELDWPIEVEEAEDITFDYNPKELGIEEKYAANINVIKQIRPFVDNQPWGLFYIEFESKRLPVVVLRRILKGLIHNRRNTSDHMKTWELSDLIFISTLGEEVERKISFAHFSELEEGLPVLRTFSWDPTDTYFHYLQTKLDLDKLRWPDDENDIESWRKTWSSAFKLKHREVIRTSKQLATIMAHLAKQIREQVKYVYKFEIENGPLHKLFMNFKNILIHDLKIDNFADMYAQTIAYGLFSAKATHEGEFRIDNISAMIPNTNPFLKQLFEECTKIGEDNIDKIDLDELGVRELIFLLKESNIEAVLQDFGKQKRGEDPVIHFYELFLNEYDTAQKVKRGVFYTPDPVVSFIIRSVDKIIQNEFGYADGLMDITKSLKKNNYKIKILDPAVGTGTFLQHTVREIKKKFDHKYKDLNKTELAERWNEFVPKHLFSKLFGFEIMMAPYAVAHLKLGLTLKETGYNFKSNKRLGIYLTNTLEGTHKGASTLDVHLNWLAAEVNKANFVKTGGISIIIGNPPYSVSSQNKGEYIENLMKDYKEAVNSEKNIQPLSDDYIKFIRYGQHSLEKNQFGIMAMITNNSFLFGIIHRGMRKKLLDSFNIIYVINLHGDSNKKEKCPDGSKDENVFDIQQGVSISVFIKNLHIKEKKILYCDLYGTREIKYKWLNGSQINSIEWEELKPKEPQYFLIPFTEDNDYVNFTSMTEIFKYYNTGVVTGKDEILIDFNRESLKNRMIEILDNGNISKYQDQLNNATGRRIIKNINNLNFVEKNIKEYHYRPFDIRFVYYQYNPNILERNRFKSIAFQLFKDNLSIVTSRINTSQKFNSVIISNVISDYKLGERTRGSYIFPLYDYTEIKNKIEKDIPLFKPKSNFKEDFVISIKKKYFNLKISPEMIFCYIYGVLNSPKFREDFIESLKIDFPRIPFPENEELFEKISSLGKILIDLHLMRLELKLTSKFLEDGDNLIKKVEFKNNKIFINKTQFFNNIPNDVWNFKVGGYNVSKRFLKERMNRNLEKREIIHYRYMIESIKQTIITLPEIDKYDFY